VPLSGIKCQLPSLVVLTELPSPMTPVHVCVCVLELMTFFLNFIMCVHLRNVSSVIMEVEVLSLVL
jgi:hypothetical protein